jgi:LysM repeat protein
VAEDTLASINDLTVGCSRLEQTTTPLPLCLPPTCETAQTGEGDDCWTISAQHNITYAQFLAFNPSINTDCSNLRPNGTVVCVSSPDGGYTPISLPGTNSSWALGEYADTVVPAPGSTAFGTTDQCGAYYQVQDADTCNRVSLAAKVSVALFQAINPSIDADCTNLVPGLWYCVHPTYDWNVTVSDGGGTPASSTTLPPPGPTPSGTTGSCYKWHLVASGDTCALLQSSFGVTLDQLVAWNPDLHTDCGNLLLGEAYCVQGTPLSTTTTITTPTTSSTSTRTTPPPASSTTSAPACTKTYTVQEGDYCFKIWAEFGLTEAAFRALNPDVNENCDIDIGQTLCVG